LFGVSLEVRPGQTVALLGRNGMGKTTLLRTVMGMTQIQKGRILLDGEIATGLPTHWVGAKGVRFIPDDRGIFGSLTVAENLRLGTLAGRKDEGRLDWIFDNFPILKARFHQPASVLSGGERQILAVARVFLSAPRLLLLDEFSEGLQPAVVQRLAAVLKELKDEGLTVVLVDQDARLAMTMSDHIYLIEKGRIVDHGAVQEFRGDESRLHTRLIL
jgi:branched-chain amino acid transport system ATP-binding protein